MFPSTITYLTVFVVAVVALTALGCLLWLSCSNYTVERSTYFRLSSSFPNLLLYLGVILTQYFTAAASRFNVDADHILPAVGGLAILTGSYFFLVDAMFNSKIRNPIFCREDPLRRKKTAGYSTEYRSSYPSPDESTGGSSQSTTPQPFRKKHAARNSTPPNQSNLNYVSDYLGAAPHGNHPGGTRISSGMGVNPIPLSLFGHVQQGRVRISADVSGKGPNPAYRLDLSSDV